MSERLDSEETVPAGELATILHVLAQSPDRRVTLIEAAGRRVWIKRYDIEPLAWAKRLHALVSPALFPAFLRSSFPAVGAAGVTRECGKIAAFRAAGFQTPQIIHVSGAMLILSDVSPTLTAELARVDAPERQILLLKAFGTLGRVHQGGLAHGRPHLRDISIQNGEICFFDFEKAPEAVMPLPFAQARDLWLLMLPVVAIEKNPDELASFLRAWVAEAPASTIGALIQFLAYCRPALAFARLVPVSLHGGDLRRFIAAVRFLAASISVMDSSLGEVGVSPDQNR